LPPAVTDIFAKLDTNGDSSLSLPELTPGPHPNPGAPPVDVVFAAWDMDHSGWLSLDEFVAGLASRHDA